MGGTEQQSPSRGDWKREVTGMRHVIRIALLSIQPLLLLPLCALGDDSSRNYSGRWEVTTVFPGGSYVAGLNLVFDGKGYKGRGGYLVPEGTFPFKYAGIGQPDGLHLEVLASDGKTAIGTLVLKQQAGALSGSGKLHDVAITLTARRPSARPSKSPKVHIYEPTVYYGTFSGTNPPALHVFPGDTVRTKTVDAYGNDENGV